MDIPPAHTVHAAMDMPPAHTVHAAMDMPPAHTVPHRPRGDGHAAGAHVIRIDHAAMDMPPAHTVPHRPRGRHSAPLACPYVVRYSRVLADRFYTIGKHNS